MGMIMKHEIYLKDGLMIHKNTGATGRDRRAEFPLELVSVYGVDDAASLELCGRPFEEMRRDFTALTDCISGYSLHIESNQIYFLYDNIKKAQEDEENDGGEVYFPLRKDLDIKLRVGRGTGLAPDIYEIRCLPDDLRIRCYPAITWLQGGMIIRQIEFQENNRAIITEGPFPWEYANF